MENYWPVCPYHVPAVPWQSPGTIITGNLCMPGPHLCLPVDWEIGTRRNKADVQFWPCYQREGIAHAIIYCSPLCHMQAVSTHIIMAEGRSCSTPKLLCRFGSSLVTLVICARVQNCWAVSHSGTTRVAPLAQMPPWLGTTGSLQGSSTEHALGKLRATLGTLHSSLWCPEKHNLETHTWCHITFARENISLIKINSMGLTVWNQSTENSQNLMHAGPNTAENIGFGLRPWKRLPAIETISKNMNL